MIVKCWESDCHKIKIDGKWIESSGILCGEISHGICPEHAIEWEKKVEEYLASQDSPTKLDTTV